MSAFRPELARPPAVAGRFYPGGAGALEREVVDYLQTDRPPEPAIAMMGPHAGYVYSGAILGETYARVKVPGRAIVMCPNHTGLGVRRSLWAGGTWQLPGAEIRIDEELAERVRVASRLEPDLDAHVREHAIEVHLPFLHHQNPDARIVPIVLAGLRLEDCREVGHGLAKAIRETKARDGDDVLIVASSDMSHYVSAQTAKRLDGMALDRVVALDPAGLYETVRAHDISMCGFIPTTCALFAALELGATKAQLVRYGNSGQTSGDYDHVVGYAGVVVS